MTKEPLVLVIEDEPELRRYLREELHTRGLATEEAVTAETGLGLALSLRPDVVLLDLGLPDRDGLWLLGELRKTSSLPVIVLSARGRESDKVAALDAGADDYLAKPFGHAELWSRIKVVLRRVGPFSVNEPLVFGPLVWSQTDRRVFLEGKEVHLTPIEYRLFGAMALHPGRILTHRWLLKEVWGRESDDVVHYVRIAVAGLRKKLEPATGASRFLHTEVGVGYRFFQ